MDGWLELGSNFTDLRLEEGEKLVHFAILARACVVLLSLVRGVKNLVGCRWEGVGRRREASQLLNTANIIPYFLARCHEVSKS